MILPNDFKTVLFEALILFSLLTQWTKPKLICTVACTSRNFRFYFGTPYGSTFCNVYSQTALLSFIRNHTWYRYLKNMAVCVSPGTQTTVCASSSNRWERCGDLACGTVSSQCISEIYTRVNGTSLKVVWDNLLPTIGYLIILLINDSYCQFSVFKNCERCDVVNFNIAYIIKQCRTNIHLTQTRRNQKEYTFSTLKENANYKGLMVAIKTMNIFGVVGQFFVSTTCPRLKDVQIMPIESLLTNNVSIEFLHVSTNCTKIVFDIVLRDCTGALINQHQTYQHFSVMSNLEMNMLYYVNITAIRIVNDTPIEKSQVCPTSFYTGVSQITLLNVSFPVVLYRYVDLKWILTNALQGLVFLFVARLLSESGCESVIQFSCQYCKLIYSEKYLRPYILEQLNLARSCKFVALVKESFPNDSLFEVQLPFHDVQNMSIQLFAVNLDRCQLVFEKILYREPETRNETIPAIVIIFVILIGSLTLLTVLIICIFKYRHSLYEPDTDMSKDDGYVQASWVDEAILQNRAAHEQLRSRTSTTRRNTASSSTCNMSVGSWNSAAVAPSNASLTSGSQLGPQSVYVEHKLHLVNPEDDRYRSLAIKDIFGRSTLKSSYDEEIGRLYEEQKAHRQAETIMKNFPLTSADWNLAYRMTGLGQHPEKLGGQSSHDARHLHLLTSIMRPNAHTISHGAMHRHQKTVEISEWQLLAGNYDHSPAYSTVAKLGRSHHAKSPALISQSIANDSGRLFKPGTTNPDLIDQFQGLQSSYSRERVETINFLPVVGRGVGKQDPTVKRLFTSAITTTATSGAGLRLGKGHTSTIAAQVMAGKPAAPTSASTPSYSRRSSISSAVETKKKKNPGRDTFRHNIFKRQKRDSNTSLVTEPLQDGSKRQHSTETTRDHNTQQVSTMSSLNLARSITPDYVPISPKRP